MERVDLSPSVVRWVHEAAFGNELLRRWREVTGDMGPAGQAALNRQDRFYLLTVTCGRADMFRGWLYDRCREVEAEPDDRLDLWFREGYKSTIITFGGSIQEVLKDPEITIGIFSNTGPRAKKFLSQIRLELQRNPVLKLLHADVLWDNPARDAPKWALDTGICVKRKTNPKEQTIEAHGLVDSMPTGAHFKLRIYDDVVTKESVGTPEQAKKTTDAWSLSNALGAAREGPNGEMLPGRAWHIGTRYSFADTYQTMMEMRAVTPRIYPATDNGRRDGKPVFFSDAQWQDKLKTMVPSVLAAQMLQNPAAGNEAMFNADWLRFTDIRAKTLNVYILCDPANSKKKDSDNSAMAVIGIDAGRNKLLLDGYDHKMNLRERWQNLKNLHQRWSNEPGVQLVKVGYERYGMQADLEYFEERMEIEKIHFDIEEVAWPIEGPGSKEDRVERLVPDFMNGKFWLIATPPRGKDIGGRRVLKPDSDAAPEEMRAYLALSGLEQEFETSAQRKCREAGEVYRILKLPMRRDHEQHGYSVNKSFLAQFLSFPFSQKKDFIDACSRVYDLDPQPPVIIDERSLEPEVFSDGI